MKKKLLCLLLATLLLVGIFAGCASDETTADTGSTDTESTDTENTDSTTESTDGEEITLRWVGAGWSLNQKADKIIEKWNAIHPEIQIEYIEPGTTVDTSYLANLDTMVSGGEVVDLTYLTYAEVYNRVINGGALPIDEYIEANGDDYEGMYGSMSKEMLSYNGELYGIPYAGNTYKVFYNKTMTDAAGITIPEQWSIEEFTEVARQLNDPDNGVYGCCFPFTWDAILYASAELSGWTSVVKQDDGTIVPNFDDERLRTALSWAKGLADEGLSPDLATMQAESLNRRQVLAEQQAAMLIDGPFTLVWLQTYMFDDPGEGALDFELGVTNIPYIDEDGKDVSYNTVAGAFYIPKSAAHPAEAYEFAKFICDECPEEAANYMPIYTGADMEAATKSFTEYTDTNGELHTDIYPLEVATGAVATPYESYVGKYGYDPTLAPYTSVMATLFSEQYALYVNGEMELDDWIDMMQELGAAEIAALG